MFAALVNLAGSGNKGSKKEAINTYLQSIVTITGKLPGVNPKINRKKEMTREIKSNTPYQQKPTSSNIS
jgi:hypothetical protein